MGVEEKISELRMKWESADESDKKLDYFSRRKGSGSCESATAE